MKKDSGVKRLTEKEFIRIKGFWDMDLTYKQMAQITGRSGACIYDIRMSKNYTDYKDRLRARWSKSNAIRKGDAPQPVEVKAVEMDKSVGFQPAGEIRPMTRFERMVVDGINTQISLLKAIEYLLGNRKIVKRRG